MSHNLKGPLLNFSFIISGSENDDGMMLIFDLYFHQLSSTLRSSVATYIQIAELLSFAFFF